MYSIVVIGCENLKSRACKICLENKSCNDLFCQVNSITFYSNIQTDHDLSTCWKTFCHGSKREQRFLRMISQKLNYTTYILSVDLIQQFSQLYSDRKSQFLVIHSQYENFYKLFHFCLLQNDLIHITKERNTVTVDIVIKMGVKLARNFRKNPGQSGQKIVCKQQDQG